MNYREIFELQDKYKLILRKTDARERIRKLKMLEKAFLSSREKFKKALEKDLRKHSIESDLTEISTVLAEIRYIRRRLRSWMKERRVQTPRILTGTSSWIRYEPRGTVLIIAPWNYPVNLSLVPLVGAIAAGNTVILKPSELAPAVSRELKNFIGEIFDVDEVAVFEGGPETSSALLDLPFNHIFFTGSTRIGKIVMEKSSAHLSSITLELGGKCPVIIDGTVDIKKTVDRIIWSKMINSGQTCIAPDHVLVHESIKTKFIDLVQQKMNDLFHSSGENEEQFSCLISKKQYEILEHQLDKEIAKGAEAISFGQLDKSRHCFSPTLLTDIDPEGFFAREEIFGPILPVLSWQSEEELINRINEMPAPLAIYVYSRRTKLTDRVIRNTISGSVVINHGLLQFSNTNLPFGGVNSSGIGKYHGRYSFETFSHEKALLKQWFPVSASSIFKVPYSKTAKTLSDFMVRWL